MDQIPTLNTDYSWIKDNKTEHMIMYLQHWGSFSKEHLHGEHRNSVQ